jgi:hypothetical protein
MGGLLQELGKQLADRWLTLLVVPGVLYVGVAVTAETLGQTAPFDVHRLTDRLTAWQDSATTTSGLILILCAVLLASAGAGLLAQALGSLVEKIWLADSWESWPPPLRGLARFLVRRRLQRWTAATNAYQQLVQSTADELARGRSPDHDVAKAHLGITQVAQEKPDRPDWIGDRVRAAAVRMEREYRLDLPTAWPHLWLVMPDNTRTEITAAREALGRATVLAGWGLLYLLVGALWWPGLIISAAVLATARRRARSAAETYGLLVEASARLYAAPLAVSLGLNHTGRLDRRTGWAVTCLLQGQVHLIPLTTGWPGEPESAPSQ